MNNKQILELEEKYGVEIDHREGKEKITFADKFFKVFPDYFKDNYIDIDEHLGFIVTDQYFYFNESWLDTCIENKFYNGLAVNYYEECIYWKGEEKKLIDNFIVIRNFENKKTKLKINDYNKGAIAMLEHISKNEGWEETSENFFNEFF